MLVALHFTVKFKVMILMSKNVSKYHIQVLDLNLISLVAGIK